MVSEKSLMISKLLEETGYECAVSGGCDADYAEFAGSHALSSFREALKDPEMSYERLCRLLREASESEARENRSSPWSVFMSNYIETHCNCNHSSD